MLVTRVLPEAEWPRLAETGCLVDRSWSPRAVRGCVISVEQWTAIIATAFVFVTADDVPHVDGLWIAPTWRGKVSALRAIYRGIQYAVKSLGGGPVPVEAAVWMTRPERRAHGVEF